MTKATKTRTEHEMTTANLDMLIDYYLGSMQRRGCTPDSVVSCERALKGFHRFLTGGAPHETARLSAVTQDRLNAFVDQLQTRTTKFEGHPHRPVEQAKLSPFTIVAEIRALQ